MKQFITIVTLVFCAFTGADAQEKMNHLQVSSIIDAQFRGESEKVRDWDNSRPFANEITKAEKLGYNPKGDWPLHEVVDPNALPQGADPAWQTEKPIHIVDLTKSAMVNYDGMGYTGVNPSDNILDVGPNHVIQMINSDSGALFQIFDKGGNNLTDPIAFDNFFGFGSGLGDPIVLYDALADRWFMAEFTSNSNDFNIAVSRTSDPLGSYWLYTFTAPNFPDYLKFGVWTDMYIMTSNESGPSAIYALDRNNMLNGDPASMQRFTVPDYPTIGFQATTPVTFDIGNAPPSGAPGMFMRMADDAWSTEITNDRLEIWSMDIDFTNSSNSVVSGPVLINTEPFDTELCGYLAFACFQQPGTGVTLDPLREVLMNRVQYKNFGTHEAIVCNHVTDVDGTDRGGIRWYELRRTGGISNPWGIHQQGTYSPDSDSRFMAGIALNEAGDISLFYNVTSNTTFPGVRYTGRYAGDPLGQMTLSEVSIIEGSASNASNRYGDYNSLDVDPSDGISFWGTSNYNPSSTWATRIAAYAFSALNCDAPIISTEVLEDCVNGTFEVEVTIGNEGDASSYTLTSFGTDTSIQSELAPGVYTIGPFTIGEVISILVEHAEDPACNRTVSGITGDGTSCCDAPTLDVTTVPDCEAGIFNINLSIAPDGDASTYVVYSIINGEESLLGSFDPGPVDAGDYPLGTVVDIRVEHSSFGYCDQTISGITVTTLCNDECTGAIEVQCGTLVSGTTIGSTVESPDPGFCGTSSGSGGGIWYRLEGVNSNNPSATLGSTGDDVILSMCSENGASGSANYDSKLRVYSGSCGSLVCVTGDDDACTGTSSRVEFSTLVGEDYYILVHGFSGAEGNFDLDIQCTPTAPPPHCDNGIQDEDETGVDCGGADCPACPVPCDGNELTLNFILDNYPEETSWTLVDESGITIESGGTYGDEPDGSTLTIPLCVPDGCYDFNLFDSFGDGICCGFGNGSYSLTADDGTVLASGGEFDSSETTNFCISSDGGVCEVFDTPPVDLTKSLQPVPFPNGVIDRVQLKFYKESPEIKYTAVDDAALDIQFWPIRDLTTNTPIINGDTSLIADKVKPGQDFFKWPVKFIRPDIEPNVRYRWRVRTKCQTGDLRISPWSLERIFNTPDFDPGTGIYTPPEGISIDDLDKGLFSKNAQVTVFPNPNGGEELVINIDADERLSDNAEVQVLDMTGKLLHAERLSIQEGKLGTLIHFEPPLNSGMYLLTIELDGILHRMKILVD